MKSDNDIIEYDRITLSDYFQVYWKVHRDGWCEQGGSFRPNYKVDAQGNVTGLSNLNGADLDERPSKSGWSYLCIGLNIYLILMI